MNKTLKNIKKISLLGFIVLAFFACKPDEPEVEPEVLNGNLSGKIVGKDARPIEGAEVILIGADTTYSDVKGLFSFTEIPAKSYKIKAYKEAYLDSDEKSTLVVGGKTNDNNTITLTLGDAPSVSTNSATDVYMTIAKMTGRITGIGSDDVLSYGHCWSTNSAPTINDNITDFGTTSQASPIESDLEYLKTGTQYYARAYAMNRFGTVYGGEITFKTDPGEPTVTTNAVTDAEFNRAEVLGNVTKIGANAITQHGHVWSKTSEPTINDFKTELGGLDETAGFKSIIEDGLEMETEYYVRAYAINNEGISYSEEVSFLTTNRFKDKRNSQWYNIIKIGNQIWMQDNLHYDDNSIASYCYADNAANCSDFGSLFEWSALQTAAPAGWHIPSEAEWNILITGQGGAAVAGGKMKDANGGYQNSSYWQSPHTGASNDSGFSARGSGYMSSTHKSSDFNISTSFWISEEANTAEGRCVKLDISTAAANVLNFDKKASFSVRCILD